MLRGLYTAAAGMVTQQRRHDTVTNNIANLNTPGYKQSYALQRSFPDMLLDALRTDKPGGTPNGIGRLNTGVFAEEDVSIHLQGDLQETDNPYDFALVSNIQVAGMQFDASGKYVDANGNRTFKPHALFTLLNADGERRYSLNGKFTVNTQGQLTNSNGDAVLGADGQPIVLMDAFDQPIKNFNVSSDGTFYDDNQVPITDAAGANVQLLLTKANDPRRLIRDGNGLFRVNAEDQGTLENVAANDQVEVKHRFMERSNVDPAQAAVDLMAAARAYEANQKMVQYYDRSLDKAVNEIGRV